MAILSGQELHHIPITLRNEATARDWYERLTKFAHETNVTLMVDSIMNVMRINPDVMEYINELGSLNGVTIEKRAKQTMASHKADYDHRKAEILEEGKEFDEVYEPLTEAESYKIAVADLQQAWTNFLRDNPAVGKALYFNLEGFPATIEALRLGIDCIRQTLDRKRTSLDVIALIDSANDSDFWLDASATEVAGYVDGFRSQFK